MVNWWDHINTFIAAIAATLAGIIIGLMRKILTNEQEINILKAQLQSFEKDIDEVKGDIKLILQKLID